MELSRREVLKLTGSCAVASMLPEPQLFQDSAPASSPLDERYLRRGLDLLCTAHESDAFESGHAGGAVISAYYFCREEALEPGTVGVIRGALDAHYPRSPGGFPDEPPAEAGIAGLLQSMEEGLEELCRDGHDLIFLSLALRAFHDLPATATPSRIAGLRRTLQALSPRIQGQASIEIPSSVPDFAAFVLEEFLGSTEGVAQQGFAGHLLTNGRALVDLRSLGHEAFAEKCRNALRLFVARARPRSPRLDYREPRAARTFLRPTAKEYWVRRVSAGKLELGHLFKYPYGFYGLRRLCANEQLNTVCLENSQRLFFS